MARGTVRHDHATQRTEQINPESEHTFRMGYSYCDPKHTKRVAPSRANDWRGSTGIFTYADQEEADLLKTNCPDCAKAWGKEQITKLGDRITIEKIDNYCGYVKSTYRITLDGILRGYVVIQNGWGEKWRIHAVAMDDRSKATFSRTDEPVGRGIESNLIHMIHKSSVYGLASLFPALVEAGKLPTAAEQVEAERRRVEERETARLESEQRAEERRVQREADERDRSERRQLAREAVQAISERADKLGLSNSETMGLLEALKIIG